MVVALSDTNVSLTVRSTMSESLDLKTRQAALAFSRSIAFDNGTGASQADKIWDDTRTITASGTDDIDLAGVLLDAFGAALTFAKVKLIAVAAYAANTNNCVVGNAAATQFVGPFGAATHTVAVAPGGFFMVGRPDAAGWAVGAGASDLLRVTNSAGGTSVTYDVVILGTSA
jgi:hypothetical protein